MGGGARTGRVAGRRFDHHKKKKKTVGSQEIRKYQGNLKLLRIIAQRPASPPPQKENFTNTSKKLLQIGIGPLGQCVFHTKPRVCLELVPNILSKILGYLSPLSFILPNSNKPWIALNLLLALYKTIQKLSHRLWQPAFVRALPSFYRSFFEVYRLHWLETINKRWFTFTGLLSLYCNAFQFYCLNSVQIRSFFWPLFSRFWTEDGDLLCKSPYSVQTRENKDYQNSKKH